MVQEYILLSYASSEKLSDEVNEHIGMGWELYGSPCVTSDENHNFYCQAMILKGDE